MTKQKTTLLQKNIDQNIVSGKVVLIDTTFPDTIYMNYYTCVLSIINKVPYSCPLLPQIIIKHMTI